MRRTVLGALLCAPLLGGSTWLRRNDGDVAKGQQAYGTGSYTQAAQHFRRALSGAASRDIAQFNLGTALCEQGRRERSESEKARLLQLGMVALRSALDADEESLRVSALYNLGNAQVWAADYPAAIASFKDVLRQAPNHLEASHNLEVAQLRLRNAPPKKGSEAGGAGDSTEAGTAEPESGAGQGEESGPEGAESGGGSSTAGTESGESGAAGAGETETGEPRPMQAEPRAMSRPGSFDDSSIDEKLRALERRSGELRRARVLRRSKALRALRGKSERSK